MAENAFVISPDHPFIPGHFPGQPVVPGVILLERMLSLSGIDAPCMLRKLKFLKQVLPGQEVTVQLKPGKAGRHLLEAESEGERVASVAVINDPGQASVAASSLDPDAVSMDARQIAARIPHAGRSALLSSALGWNSEQIVCEATSHRDSDNPLLADGRLSSLVLPEYVSQGIALHGALMNQQTEGEPRVGYLAVMPKLALYVDRIDRLQAPLHIRATILLKQQDSCMYGFSVVAGKKLLAQGEAGVFLQKMDTGIS